MISKVSSDLFPLTRELAVEFSQMPSASGERPLRDPRLRFFLNHLSEGTFRSPTWSKALIADDPKAYRVDGQHTSTACATCDAAVFPQNCPVTINTWRIDSRNELADLFDTFDHPKSVRSNTDKMGVYVADYQDLLEVDRKFLAKTAHGIDHYHRYEQVLQPGAPPPTLYPARDFGLYFYDDIHRRFAVWLYQFNNAHPHGWMLTKPGIVAEMFADWKSYTAVAGQFWSYVIFENHPDKEDDTRELARVFKEWSHKVPFVKQEKYMARARKIWERYRRGLALASLDSQQQANLLGPQAA